MKVMAKHQHCERREPAKRSHGVVSTQMPHEGNDPSGPGEHQTDVEHQRNDGQVVTA